MNSTGPFLIVTIDTECDKSSDWRTAKPLRFRATTEAIPLSLQPLFESFGIRPTYFLSPEVIACSEPCSVLRELRHVELGAHLHGDYLLPQIKTWDFAGSFTDEMQLEYGADLEQQKMAVLTELFIQQFGRAPISFRAGRFGVGPHSGRILSQLGYRVDSSVTPHVTWTTRQGEKRPDFRSCPEFPYSTAEDGNLWQAGTSDFLEVPVTILPAGAVGQAEAAGPVWFRPWYSDAETLCRVADHVLGQAPQDGYARPLVMMFHNVELVAGASPYPQTEAEVSRFLDQLKRTFEWLEQKGVNSCTLSEYYYHRQQPLSAENSTFRASALTGVLEPQRPNPTHRLALAPGLVQRVLQRHEVPTWFLYIFRERESRWDCWQPCSWIAQNFPAATPVLSLGTGVGFNLFWLAEAGFRVLHGCDLDAKVIAAGQEIARLARLPVKLWVDDAIAPKCLPTQRYGVIEALNWTHLLPNFCLTQLLDTWLPFLAEDGAFIIDVIDAEYNAAPNNQYCTHDLDKPVAERRSSEYQTRHSQAEVEAAFASRGLTLSRIFCEPQTIPKKVYIARRDPKPEFRASPATLPSAAPKAKPRVLLIADVPNWIFGRHCRTLEKFLRDEFAFTVQYMGERIQESEFDLIYPLEFNLVAPEHITNPSKWVTGIRSHTAWYDRDLLELARFLAENFQRVHAVSRRLQHIFQPMLPSVEYLTHGVDTDFFAPRTYADQSGCRLRLGWAGSRLYSSKGFQQFIAPLGRLPGVELIFCGHMDVNLDLDGMCDFYNSLDAYVCASEYEGNNNSLLEAAAMRRAIITTDNGTVPEYLVAGECALIVERGSSDFAHAVMRLRDNPGLRRSLGEQAREAVKARFEWKMQAEKFRTFFRAALATAVSWRPVERPLGRKI